MALTPEEIQRRLETPEERHAREQEEFRKRTRPHGVFATAREQREYERRKAEQDRRQDAAIVERQKADAAAERRREAARREIEADLVAAARARRWAEFKAANPDKSESFFENNIWPVLRPIVLEEALAARQERLLAKASAGVGRM
jgi:hypothetical protein